MIVRSKRTQSVANGEPDWPATVDNPHVINARAVKTCPHRSKPEGCGCTGGMAICAAGKIELSTDGKVSFGFCLQCVRGEA
jgi:hypothetical protein